MNPGTTPPRHWTLLPPFGSTSAQLQAMIDEGVTAVLAARATTRNDDDSHTSGTGVQRSGRIGPSGLRGWKPLTNMNAYEMTWADLKTEDDKTNINRGMKSRKIEAELWNLKYRQWVSTTDLLKVVASKPKNTMQEANEMAIELMDREITLLLRDRQKPRGSLIHSSNYQNNNQTKGRKHRQGFIAAGNGDTRKLYEGTINSMSQCVTSTITGLVYQLALMQEAWPPGQGLPLQEGLPPVEEQEPGKWQRCSQGLCSGSCRPQNPKQHVAEETRESRRRSKLQDVPSSKFFPKYFRGLCQHGTFRLALSEMNEWQINYRAFRQRLIRPSSSPWGAPSSIR
ncbi:hypothetical protein Tco_1401505 [Tanacetum coccineum]